jgi:hypothetical protein
MASKRFVVKAALAVAAAAVSVAAYASHSWGNYHWARTTTSFNLQVIDSTSPLWDSHLNASLSQWSQSGKLNLAITGADDSSRTRKQCRAVSGKIRVCNASYGNNGWLGLASINLDSKGHIVQGTAKMNDSYDWYFVDNPSERPHVMCQEVGHLFGLGHTSEDGSSQQTCMDYSNDPRSTTPNSHDYQQLDTIYGHLDSYNSYATSTAAAAPSGSQNSMAGQVPMGVRIHRGHFHEVWAAPDGRGGTWIHHVTLAPGYEHLD